jgi:hypothetical protein
MNGSSEDLVPRLEAVFGAWMAGRASRAAAADVMAEACCTHAEDGASSGCTAGGC